MQQSVDMSAAQPSVKEVSTTDILETLFVFIKILASLLSLWFTGRKLIRWIRKRIKRKPPIKG